MPINITPLIDAIKQLEEGLRRCEADRSDTLARDGTIQRFEYTYELAHKMMKRYLEATEANPDTLDKMTFPDIVRLASERGLVMRGWDAWSDYRTARGTTSHTYDEKKAAQVFSAIPQFLEDAQFLRDEILKRQKK